MALTDEKFNKKQQLLVERTSKSLNIGHSEAEKLLRISRQQSVRVNTLRFGGKEAIEQLVAAGAKLKPVPWLSEGYYVETGIDIIRDHASTEEGDLYIQNAASWLPVLALDPQPGEAILDMCAAPGGKTSHIAQRASNQAFITANDNSRPRLLRLQRNLERLNVNNVMYTLHDATLLSRHLTPESFDKILLDAPCSGEGMMLLDRRKDFESWSVAHIKRLQQLQKKLIVQAWQLLKPGGTLVYSTCTMAPEENEAVVDYLLRHNDDVMVEKLKDLEPQIDNRSSYVLEWNGKKYDERLLDSLRLKPSDNIEAFFVVKLRKNGARSS